MAALKSSAVLALVGLLVLPGAASAADTFVAPGGSDGNNCLSTASPCATIGGVAGGLFKASAGATVRVAAGTYAETLTLNNDKKLLGANPATTVIDNGAVAAPAITVITAGSRVEGFKIRSNFQPLSVQAAATITGNIFDGAAVPTGPNAADVNITAGAGSPLISSNTFDDDGAGEQSAVVSASTGSPVISNNRISDFLSGIVVSSAGSATPVVSGNEITGIHSTLSLGVGIRVLSGTNATVTANYLHDPGINNPFGMLIFQNTTVPPNAGASLHGNRIIGHQVGVGASGNLGAVTLDSDLIAKTNDAGISMNEIGVGQGGGDVTATNVTVIESFSGSSISLGEGATLTLDSSIVSAGGFNVGVNDPVGGNCVITSSRGDGNGDCASGFVTTADPMFVNSAGNDYHLLAGSPMIDFGNPAAPTSATDIDGDPRAFPQVCGAVARRDIGADEFVHDCTAPSTMLGKSVINGTRRQAKFRFSSSEPGSSFLCKLDKKALVGCSSPKRYRRLKHGRHRFRVFARDAAGNLDPTPAIRKFRIP